MARAEPHRSPRRTFRRFEMCEIKPLGQRGHTPPVFRHSTVQNASWRYPESPGSSKSAPRRKGACTAASRRVRDLQIGRFWPQVWGGRGVTTAFLFCVLPGDVRRLGRKYGTRRRPTQATHGACRLPAKTVLSSYCLRPPPPPPPASPPPTGWPLCHRTRPCAPSSARP